jgi:predicted AAA+ superfamily ATPase
MPYLERHHYLEEIEDLLKVFPVVALLGAHQCGKSTLADAYIQKLKNSTLGIVIHYFDLENPTDEARLVDPQIALQDLEGKRTVKEV